MNPSHSALKESTSTKRVWGRTTFRQGTIHPEILAVTVIVVGMAVFAVPHAFVAPAPTQVVSETEDLWMMRTAVALYQIEHNDELPGQNNSLITDLLPYLPREERHRIAERFHPESVVTRDDRAPNDNSHPRQARWLYDAESGDLHPLSN